ncbi:MAG: M50 family metallopeptidase [Clostridia bacterium]|nr:M50 family metallopeptidase [Clostridia bacterium]
MKKFALHPLFLLLGIGMILCGFAWVFFTYLLVALLHEAAHATVARKLGYSLSGLYLMPYGAGLSLSQHFADEKDEILIAAAGPIFNFALAFFTISLWWIFPSIFGATQHFVYANIITGMLNLFPAYPLDGGRILTSILTIKNHSRKHALRVCFVFNYALAGIFVVIFLSNIFENITFLIFAIFVFLGTLDSKFAGNYTLKNFPFFEGNFPQDGQVAIHHFAITDETEIYKLARYLKKNKLNLAYVIDANHKIKILNQSTIINLFSKYPAHTKIKEIIKN